MNRRLLSFALAGLVTSGQIGFAADGATGTTAPLDMPSLITTSASQHNPEITCTTSDTLACADTLQMADDARLQLAPLLKLGPHGRFPVHIRVMAPDDPLLAKIDREAAAVFADAKGMHIEAVVPASDPNARIFIQRQFVTALLWEKFFANTEKFDGNTPLDRVPAWLIEGLSQWLNDDPSHTRETIVRKAVSEKRAPTLEEIAGWTQISKDRIMGLWQGSFCYYLVNSLIVPGPKRDNFQQWLNQLSGPTPGTAQQLFPTELGWQRELVDATQRSQDVVYTWEETQAAIIAAETVTLPTAKGSDPKTATLDNLGSLAVDPQISVVLNQKLLDLTGLELRAHPSWHQTLELYRSGLSTLISGKDPAMAQKILTAAHSLRVSEAENHQKLVDYVNWFEVTRDYPGAPSHFTSYFTTAQQLEKVQADPNHPNQIRADLLQIESQL